MLHAGYKACGKSRDYLSENYNRCTSQIINKTYQNEDYTNVIYYFTLYFKILNDYVGNDFNAMPDK